MRKYVFFCLFNVYGLSLFTLFLLKSFTIDALYMIYAGLSEYERNTKVH